MADILLEREPKTEISQDHITRIAIIDAGSQYLKVIDRKVRHVGADTEILPIDTPAAGLVGQFDAVIISGGPASVYDEGVEKCDPGFFAKDYPLATMNICFGFQQMNQERGGTVAAEARRQDGQCKIDITDTEHPLFSGYGEQLKVLMSHGDSVTTENLAPSLKALAVSHEGGQEIVVAFQDETGTKIGLQFHPEVDLTDHSEELFERFIRDVAGLKLNYNQEARKTTINNRVAKTVGKPIVTAASGGVDSTVLAVALAGEQQQVVHIDTGFMRKGESKLVIDALRELELPNIHFIDATQEFRYATTIYNRQRTPSLQNSRHPEVKRHIAGDTFARILKAKFQELGLSPETAYLAQGTLRPDLIESAGIGKRSAKIKTHHNDSPLIRAWRESGMIIEPFSDLHKDEVRELGLELGLSESVVFRQPFPGPGGIVRIICGHEPNPIKDRKGTEKVLNEFTDTDTSIHILPIKTVGVQGDDRTYKHVAAITTNDAPDWERFVEYASEIPKIAHQISRVVFMFGGQIDQKLSLFDTVTPTYLTPDIVELWQEADDQVNQSLVSHGLLRKISQEPVILTQLNIDKRGTDRLVVARPFVTNDFMVGVAPTPGSEYLPLDALRSQYEAAMSVKGVGRFAIDLTSKPPGTTEWE